MGDKSGIEWTEATWNPVVGCSKVSPGCAHCYAETLHSTRMDGKFGYPDFRPWTPANAEHNVTLVPERLDQPLRWRRPRLVFTNSMSDLFHENVPDEYIAQVFGIMATARQHTFQVLTKRPERMADLLNRPGFWRAVARITDLANRDDALWVLNNVWLGTSIENRRFVHRADDLRATPAAVRFISAEPLLGPLVYDDRSANGSYATGGMAEAGLTISGDPTIWERHWHDEYEGPELDLTGIDWIIVGGESGAGHRPMKPEWVRDLRDAVFEEACNRPWPGDGGVTGPAFFFKQWGGRTPKAGGRMLDGQTWDEMPI